MNVFLIDADNLNSGAWVDEAFRVLQDSEGQLPVRRAYGSAENLKALADTLCAWAVRPFVNLALTKNTTDMALAVDAMELACQSPAPGLIVIGSGDADFTPLVVRLRERGIRVVCVSERSKMGREAVPAYDRVILVGPEQGTQPAPATPARKTARKTAAKKTTSNQASAQKPAVKTPAKKVAAKTTARIKTSVDQPGADQAVASDKPVPPVSEAAAHTTPVLDLAAILAAVPALQSGQAQPLAAVAKALLDARLRGKNMTATKLLKKFPHLFVLAPPEKPRTVQYTPAPPAA